MRMVVMRATHAYLGHSGPCRVHPYSSQATDRQSSFLSLFHLLLAFSVSLPLLVSLLPLFLSFLRQSSSGAPPLLASLSRLLLSSLLPICRHLLSVLNAIS
jgi:hypothetical protein